MFGIAIGGATISSRFSLPFARASVGAGQSSSRFARAFRSTRIYQVPDVELYRQDLSPIWIDVRSPLFEGRVVTAGGASPG